MTRSRRMGKARMGATVTVSPGGSVSIRVMHISDGRPLISAEHEPHLPALQFHRQARSGASVAWTRWMTSRTTSPSTDRHDVVVELASVLVAAPEAHGDLAALVAAHDLLGHQFASSKQCLQVVGHHRIGSGLAVMRRIDGVPPTPPASPTLRPAGRS